MFSPRPAYSLKKIFPFMQIPCTMPTRYLCSTFHHVSFCFSSCYHVITSINTSHQYFFPSRPVTLFYNVSTLIRHALPVIFLSLRPTLLRFLPRYYITTARPICHVPLRFYHANILIRHILSVFFRYTLLLFPAEFLHYYGTSHTCLQFS